MLRVYWQGMMDIFERKIGLTVLKIKHFQEIKRMNCSDCKSSNLSSTYYFLSSLRHGRIYRICILVSRDHLDIVFENHFVD